MALTDNIQGYWKFDESSGNASDSTGNGNTLTNNNSATFVAAVINNGCDLERASSQYFSIADASQTGLDFSGNNSLTFAGWVNFETFDNSTMFVTKRGAGDQRQYQYRANTGGGNTMRLLVSNDGGFVNLYVADVSWSPSTGVWYHIAVTKNGNSVKFYVDGSQLGSTQTLTNGTIFDGNGAFAIGATPVEGEYGDQKMDEWGVWSRALTGAEISQLYNGGAGLSYPFSGAGGGTERDARALNLLGVG